MPFRAQVIDCTAVEAAWLAGIQLYNLDQIFTGRLRKQAKDWIYRYGKSLIGVLRHRAAWEFTPRIRADDNKHGFGFRANNCGCYKIGDFLKLSQNNHRSGRILSKLKPHEVIWDLRWILSLIA